MTETVVGVVGLGIMGSAISANLLDAGIAVVGYDVVADKLDALSARGGRAAASARDVAEQAPIVLLSLPSVAALDATIGAADGLIASRRQGLIAIETSTLPIADYSEVALLLHSVRQEHSGAYLAALEARGMLCCVEDIITREARGSWC